MKRPLVDSAMAGSLRLLRRFTNSELAERYGLHEPAQKLLYRGARASVEVAGRAAARFGKPAAASAPDDRKPSLFDLSPTEEQALVRDTMHRVADELLRPVARKADDAEGPPDDLIEPFRDLGLAEMSIPPEYGGAAEARSPVTTALIAEELAWGDLGLALVALAPLGAVHAIVDVGTDAQKKAWLPRFLAPANEVAALCIQEPDPLFDPFRLRARAKKKGGKWILDGAKTLIPLAERTAFFVVAAQVDEKRNGLFLVDREAANLAVAPVSAMGLRSAALGHIRLDGVEVDEDALLGGDEGAEAYANVVAGSRAAWAALAVGASKAVLDYVIPYCNERLAFGEPISHRQAVAFMIADIALELEGMRLLAWRAAARAEQGASFAREAYLARLQAAEKGMQIGTNGVQLLGGHGFVKDHPVEIWYRHLRAIGICEGTVLL